jgi:hypothetical protein
MLKGNFQFRSTRNGTREMADYSAIRAYFDYKDLHYFTFHHKSEKSVKAVTRHLPIDTPAEDVSNGLQDLGYSVFSVKQMTEVRAALIMEAARTSETSVDIQLRTRQYISEDCELHQCYDVIKGDDIV